MKGFETLLAGTVGPLRTILQNPLIVQPSR